MPSREGFDFDPIDIVTEVIPATELWEDGIEPDLGDEDPLAETTP
jgi:hypothetical protein